MSLPPPTDVTNRQVSDDSPPIVTSLMDGPIQYSCGYGCAPVFIFHVGTAYSTLPLLFIPLPLHFFSSCRLYGIAPVGTTHNIYIYSCYTLDVP